MRAIAHPPSGSLGVRVRERHQGAVGGSKTTLFRFLGHSAQINGLVRDHVNLLVDELETSLLSAVAESP